MEKEKITKKTAPKKAPSKKVPVKTADAKVKNIKEKVKVEEIKQVQEVVPNEPAQATCVHCRAKLEKGLNICPVCRKSQRDNRGPVIIGILVVILLMTIIVSHFAEKYNEEKVSESDYKASCNLVSYEEIVRSPKDYKNKDVKVIGKVISVDGYDSGYGNVMSITIDVNLFNGDNEQLVTFEYTDKNYEVGFIEGDVITIYGVYRSINGNTPFINAKYIVFGS